jgi:L-cysteine:1D-myo-inositol 2-amino-2-deoxy-alpha-D-glucopyranoside ligase
MSQIGYAEVTTGQRNRRRTDPTVCSSVSSAANLASISDMRFYNTQSANVERFQASDRPLSLYVCGITPYDTTHLGHAFTYAVADVLVRHLESQGAVVRYVQNVTDIDDDILRKATEVGEDWRAVGNRWTAHFINDMQRLNIRPPDHFPRASDFIRDIVAAVGALIERGLAYVSGGSVYYAVGAWPAFGRLSQLPRPAMQALAEERGNRPDDPHKRDSLDFVLWQAQAPGEPAWPSPWGPGRPGWHIECSVMSTRLLGPMLDLHAGGSDLIFPHHECEIAQSEPLTGRAPFVRCWLHVAMVEHVGAKMSKSLGNLVMVDDLLQQWSADALRVYLGRHHYRRRWAHDLDALAQADRLATKLRAAVELAGGRGDTLDATSAQAEFTTALNDDLDTPAALSRLESLADTIVVATESGHSVTSAQAVLRRLAKVFGLVLDTPEVEARVTDGWSAHLARFSPSSAKP